MQRLPVPQPETPQSGGSESEEEGSHSGWRVVDCDPCDWPEDSGNRGPALLCCMLSFLTLVGLVAALSLDQVPPLHWGVRYNKFVKSADIDSVFGPGRYLVGPMRQFLLFPSSVRTIEFTDQPIQTDGQRFEPLHTRTNDGLGLHLQISLQYRLRRDDVGLLYRRFNLAYEQVFVSALREKLIQTASQYNARDLWFKRADFGTFMQSTINNSLWQLHAECWGLQVLIVDLPDNFEKSITETQVQKQLMRTREMEQQSKTIHAMTNVIEADFGKQVRTIIAQGQANYTLITKSAHAEAQQHKIDAEAAVMNQALYTLGLISEDLVLYQRYGAIDDLNDSRLFYGFVGAAPMLVSASQ